MSTPIKRKLATILSADVAGYSQLMGADEEGTLRLLAAHRAIVDSIIGLHDGRVVNTAGDSVLAEFTSPVEAIRAATEIQEALKTRNESLPEARRMLFRIGVNLGDVMVNGDDLLGDGVNVAARLQALAVPGGVCISGSVFDQIEGKLSLRFQDMGDQTLKNIARPVRALALHGLASKAPAPPVRRRTRRGPAGALVAAALLALAGGAYFGGLIPHPGSGLGRQEASAWETVRSSNDMAALEGYLAAYPDGAHAGEARAKITALLASARQAVEAERGATERAHAEADLTRVKAEAEAVRVKTDAEAVRAQAEADAVRVKANTEAARTRAEADTEAAKVRAETERKKAAEERPAVVPPSPRESRFDGIWVGELSCAVWRGGPAVQRPQRVVVQNGEMTLDIGLPGRPRAIHSVGKVRDDDSIELRGSVLAPGGKTFEHVVKGRFANESFTGQAEPPARPCSLHLSRS